MRTGIFHLTTFIIVTEQLSKYWG